MTDIAKSKSYEQSPGGLSADSFPELIDKDKKQLDRDLNRIVCSANYHPGFPLIIGPRHWDETMHASYKALQSLYQKLYELDNSISLIPEGYHFLQGFIDKRGKWLTRKEAWKIAEAAGQIKFRVGGDEANGGTLYSENLY